MRHQDAERQYGAARVARCRRGIEDWPPPDPDGRGESLADLRQRARPYVETELLSALEAGEILLVVSHGNTIRMLRRLVEGLSDGVAGTLEVPTGRARIYRDVSGLGARC